MVYPFLFRNGGSAPDAMQFFRGGVETFTMAKLMLANSLCESTVARHASKIGDLDKSFESYTLNFSIM